MQGVMMLPASALPAQGAEAVYKRLWVHEVFRVFYDRLVDDNDRLWLLQQVIKASQITVHMVNAKAPQSFAGSSTSVCMQAIQSCLIKQSQSMHQELKAMAHSCGIVIYC